MDKSKHVPIIILIISFLIFLVWVSHVDGIAKGQSKICKQVCPTDVWRVKDDVCECVIETVISPDRIILTNES